MRIVIDARVIASGTGRYVERLLASLERCDSPHEYIVLVFSKDADYWRPTSTNFTIVTVDFKNYSLNEQVGLNGLLRRLRPDLVHFCMPQQPVFYKGAVVTTIHDLNLLRIDQNDDMPTTILRARQFIFKKLLQRVLERSKQIIVPSRYTAEDIMRLRPSLPPERVTVTYESADRLSLSPEPISRYLGGSYMLMVGRTEPYKNHRKAIEAMQLILDTHPELRLVIVGRRESSSRELEEWVRINNYINVDFFGFASADQLAWLYENCCGYIFASYMEGFGLPGLEAMKHGAPVASSNRTCLPEVYGDAALYFDPDSVDEICGAMRSLISDSNLRRQLIAAGSKRVDSYSWDRMAKQTLAVYENAVQAT